MEDGVVVVVCGDDDGAAAELGVEPEFVLFSVNAIDAADQESGDNEEKHAAHNTEGAGAIVEGEVSESGPDPGEDAGVGEKRGFGGVSGHDFGESWLRRAAGDPIKGRRDAGLPPAQHIEMTR